MQRLYNVATLQRLYNVAYNVSTNASERISAVNIKQA